MHGLMITAKTSLSREQFEALGADKAREFRAQAGLVCKTYVYQSGTMGGFHVFTDRAAAQAYLDSDGFQALQRLDEKFWDWDIRHYDVMREASAINGTPTVPLTEREAA